MSNGKKQLSARHWALASIVPVILLISYIALFPSYIARATHAYDDKGGRTHDLEKEKELSTSHKVIWHLRGYDWYRNYFNKSYNAELQRMDKSNNRNKN